VLAAAGDILARVIPEVPFLDLAPREELATNPEVGPAFERDPLTYKGKMRIGIGAAINREAKYVKTRLHEVSIPVLILHGELDKIISPTGSQRAFDTVRSVHKTHRVYPGLRHEILNERERDIVMADILAFIDGMVP
jgi:alpha-beta hydrolase superfamily lysophospholipase